MRLSPSAFLLSLAAVAACSADRVDAPHSPPQTPRVSASEIFLGGMTVFRSEASGINDGGTVVGNAELTVFDREQAAVWMPPDYHLTFLPDAGVGSSSASVISNDGTIGGTICDGAHFTPPCHPVYWRNGVLHQLGGLGVLHGICPCDGHTLVGYIDVNGNEHGAIWEDEILIDVGMPPNSADAELAAIAHNNIVGNSFPRHGDVSEVHPYRWSPTTGWVAMGNTNSFVLDVNAHGSAIGRPNLLWANGSNTPVPLPGGEVSAINDSGVVAGTCHPSPGSGPEFAPCEWTASGGWVPLSTETFTSVRDINNSNVAVGDVRTNLHRSTAVLWAP